jgi:hypothetical protein
MSISILRQVEAKTQARHFTFALVKEIAFHHHDRYGYAFPVSVQGVRSRRHLDAGR